MSQNRDQISIRRFQKRDAEFCCRIRARAFATRFKEELSEDAVVAGINAYRPEDFKRMEAYTEFFMIESDRQPVGFFVIRRINPKTAELVLIYIDLQHTSSGLGAYCCAYLERWITVHWPEIELIYVDTVIPKYNAGFYQKMGYHISETVQCTFPDEILPAVRLKKTVKARVPV